MLFEATYFKNNEIPIISVSTHECNGNHKAEHDGICLLSVTVWLYQFSVN